MGRIILQMMISVDGMVSEHKKSTHRVSRWSRTYRRSVVRNGESHAIE
jgi:hypothetical protein